LAIFDAKTVYLISPAHRSLIHLCCTFTATSFPLDLSIARWTYAKLAEATGIGSNSEKYSSNDFIASSSVTI